MGKLIITFLSVLGLGIELSIASGPVVEFNDEAINGTWVRVGEGCRMLNENELRSLAQNGGGNWVRRRMLISILDGKFEADFKASLRCESDLEKKDLVNFGNDFVEEKCEAPLRRYGAARMIKNDMLHLMAENCYDGMENPWGCLLQEWKVIRVGGAMVLNAPGNNEVCNQTPFYIYFIPLPMS